jgi:hypothetical protein
MNKSGRHRVRRLGGPLSLYKRVVALEEEVQESRRLNQELSDIVDVIAEALVPAADRDDERVRSALARLENVTGAQSVHGVRGRSPRRRAHR